MATLLTRSGWTVTADSDLGSPTYIAQNVADGNDSTFWHSGTSSYPHYLVIDLASAQQSNLLRFRGRQPAGIFRGPTSIEIYASSDGVTWGTAIAVNTAWAQSSSIRNDVWMDYPRQNKRYIKLQMLAGTDDGYAACSELWLYDTGTDQFAPHDLTGASTHSPFVISDSSHGVNYDGWRAFNGLFYDINLFWSSSSAPTQTLTIDTGQSCILFSYHILSATTANRAPNTWTVRGSNDGSSWTTVDTVSSESGWAVEERRMFDCDTTTTTYRYYKIEVTAVNGGSVVEIDEFYMYGTVAPFSAGTQQPIMQVIM